MRSRGHLTVEQPLHRGGELAQVVEALERLEHLAVVDLEVEVDQQVALPGGGGEPLREPAIEQGGIGQGAKDPGIVARWRGVDLAEDVGADIDADLLGQLKPPLGSRAAPRRAPRWSRGEPEREGLAPRAGPRRGSPGGEAAAGLG
jgi:hypothetical protein